MTFPETIPDVPPTQDSEPEVSGEQPLTQDQLKIFRIGSPLSTHFTPVTCAELNCPEYLYGFIVHADSDTAIGQQQIIHIQTSGRIYNSWWTEDGIVTFTFNQGQNGLTPHWRRLPAPPNYVIINGDAPPAVVTTVEWVAALINHLVALRATQDSVISSEAANVQARKVPLVYRSDTTVSVPAIGYELSIDSISTVGRVTSVNIGLPLDRDDTSNPIRLATLADFSVIVDGVRDRGSGVVYRRLANVMGKEVVVRLQVGLWVLSMSVRFVRYLFYRPAPDTVSWRLIGRLSV